MMVLFEMDKCRGDKTWAHLQNNKGVQKSKLSKIFLKENVLSEKSSLLKSYLENQSLAIFFT